MYTRRGARLTEGSNSWAFVINVLGTYFSNHLRIHSLRQGWHYRQDFWSEDRFYMRDFSKLNQELGNLSLCNWPFHPKPKDYLHQFLLQAQGWEFSYYSIASAYQCLHKLELSLFREGSLSTQIDIGHEDKVKAGPDRWAPPSLYSKGLPSSCSNMFVFRRFLARATSLSVTLVQSRILKHIWKWP